MHVPHVYDSKDKPVQERTWKVKEHVIYEN